MKNLWNHLQVAEFLNKSPHSIRGMVSRGEIPYIKINRSCRFDPDVIMAWVQKQARQPRPQRGVPPRPEEVKSLADAFKVSPEELFQMA